MAARKKPTRTKRAPKKRSAPDWAPRFFSALAESGNISFACAAAGVGRTAVYERRDRDPVFADGMALALEAAVDALELEARRRACEGLRRVKFHQGAPIMVPQTDESGVTTLVPYIEHEYSDTLLIFLLKAHRPEKYRETVRNEHTGKDGGPIEHTHTTLTDDERAARLTELLERVRARRAGRPA